MIARTWDAQVYVNERRLAAADSVASEAIARDSTFALVWSVRAEARLLQGHSAEAIAILERRVAELPPHRPTETHGLLAYAYARGGMVRQARTLLESLRVDGGGHLPATGMLATALEELGDHEAAIALLGEAVAQHDAWLLQYTRGERYDKLRRDPRGAARWRRPRHGELPLMIAPVKTSRRRLAMAVCVAAAVACAPKSTPPTPVAAPPVAAAPTVMQTCPDPTDGPSIVINAVDEAHRAFVANPTTPLPPVCVLAAFARIPSPVPDSLNDDALALAGELRRRGSESTRIARDGDRAARAHCGDTPTCRARTTGSSRWTRSRRSKSRGSRSPRPISARIPRRSCASSARTATQPGAGSA